jgi:hypothetical protein
MSFVSTHAMNQDKNQIYSAFPENICTDDFLWNIPQEWGSFDKNFIELLRKSCAEKQIESINGDLKTIVEDAFQIQNQDLFEIVFAILPRNPWERGELQEYITKNEKTFLERLESSKTDLSKYLLIRYYFEKINQKNQDDSQKDIKNKLQIELDNWKNDTFSMLPYLDAWSYFIFWKGIKKELTSQSIWERKDIWLYGQSMKITWYTKEAMRYMDLWDKQNFIEQNKQIEKVLKEEWSKNNFLGFFWERFIKWFEKRSDFLDSNYFTKEYINFIKSIIALNAIEPTDLKERDFKYIESIISLVESPDIQHNEVLKYNLYASNGVIHIIKPFLFSYSRKDFTKVKWLILSHPIFFSEWGFKWIENEIFDDKERLKNGPAPIARNSTGAGIEVSGEIKNDVIVSTDTSISQTTKSYLLWILYGFMIFLTILTIFYAVSHSARQKGADNERGATENNP